MGTPKKTCSTRHYFNTKGWSCDEDEKRGPLYSFFADVCKGSMWLMKIKKEEPAHVESPPPTPLFG